MVLLLTLCLQAYVNNGGRRLAVDVVGSKRLQALTAFASTIFLIPLSLMVWLTQVRLESYLNRNFLVYIQYICHHYHLVLFLKVANKKAFLL